MDSGENYTNTAYGSLLLHSVVTLPLGEIDKYCTVGHGEVLPTSWIVVRDRAETLSDDDKESSNAWMLILV